MDYVSPTSRKAKIVNIGRTETPAINMNNRTDS